MRWLAGFWVVTSGLFAGVNAKDSMQRALKLRLSAPNAEFRLGEQVVIEAELHNTSNDSVLVTADIEWPDCYTCLLDVIGPSGTPSQLIGPRPPGYDVTPESLAEHYGVVLPPHGMVKRRVRVSGTTTEFGYHIGYAGTYHVSMMASTPHPTERRDRLILWSDTLVMQINP